jgi:diguanylate cyclase (GGDEF)-like protein
MDSRRGVPRAAVCLLVCGVLAAVAVSVLATDDVAGARSISFVLVGAVGVASGVLLWRRRCGPRGSRWSARLMGLGAVVWGAGQCVVGLSQTGALSYPGPGDVLSLLAMPLGVVGLLLTLAEQDLPGARVTLVLDALLAGSAASLPLWQAAYVPMGLVPRDAAWGALLLLAETLVVAIALMAWLRDLRAPLLGTLVGLVAFVVGDQSSTLSALHGRPVPLTALTVSAVAWPLIAASLSQYRPVRARASRDPAADGRSSVIATGVACASLATMASSMGARGSSDVDPQLGALVGVVLLAFGVREVVASRRRTRLVHELVSLATTDPLTGAGNRRRLTGDLAAAPGGSTVWTIDLDRFKEVNDVLGHARGDDVLRAVARQMLAALRAGELYRIGGDEFVALVPAGERRDEVGESLLRGLRRVTGDLSDSSGVLVTGSIGVAVIEDADRDVDRLQALARSNFAMHAAKTAGRDRLAGYDADVAAAHRRAVQLEARLRRAVDQSEIDVHYQPIMSLTGAAPLHVEALARWTDAELGPVSPAEFVPVAERSGLVVAMGLGVLRRALGDLARVDAALPGAVVAVNVSPVQLRSPDFPGHVLASLRAAGLAPERLVIEVTETTSVDEDDGALSVLRELRSHGVGIALDDFGSGYSSMSYLTRLPATIVKVDRSLTSQVLTDQRAHTVMRSIIELSRGLGMQVCVEGIETADQHDLVARLGADLAQGWLYAAAVPWSDLCAVLPLARGVVAAVKTAPRLPIPRG